MLLKGKFWPLKGEIPSSKKFVLLEAPHFLMTLNDFKHLDRHGL